MVPFRAGDWKCGNEGCGYHNFAKNVSCLRCNASRAGAAVVADSSFTAPMDPPTGYGMGPGGPMGGNPGPGPFGPPPGGYGAGGFGGGSAYGGPNTYGAGNPSGGWPPMGNSGGYPQQQQQQQQQQPQPPTSAHSAAFDSRATEAAFSSAANTAPPAQSGGPSYGSTYGSLDNSADPFAFLNAGMGGLSMNDESRRNGANASKSPTS
jgi:hypothetical protein